MARLRFSRLSRGVISILFAVSISLLMLAALNRLYPLQLPDDSALFSRVVVDKGGQPLRAFADKQGVWRYPVTADQVSPLYIEALLTYEDRWFYQHPGINPLSIIRAAWQNLSSGRVVSGGSTLTMQVARLLYPHSRSYKGKFYQLLRALQLEWQLDKQQILTLYLNLAPFGGTLQGVQAASYAYLSKPSSQLTHAEAALLAVLPQAPSRLRPDRYPDRAMLARNKVLNRLAGFKRWSAERVIEAHQEHVFVDTPKLDIAAPLLARRLSIQYPQLPVLKTTINGGLQRQIEEQVAFYSDQLPKGSSVAVLVVENPTSDVKAYIGSADFSDDARLGHVDMVRAIRSPGSTLKPFVYGMALDQGLIHSASLLSDTPRYWSDYQPGNFTGQFSGPVSAADALSRSLNVPAVNMLEKVGIQRFHDQMQSAGISISLPGRPSLATILGGAGISLETLVMAYAALANKGRVRPLNYLIDQQIANDKKSRYLLSEGASWILHQMLQPKVSASSLLSSQQSLPVAIKTGTSYGFRDSWAIGFSADYTIGVWVGRPDGTPVPGHYGRRSAVPLLMRIGNTLPIQSTLTRPASVSNVKICWPSGLALSDLDGCNIEKDAWVLENNIPPTLLDEVQDSLYGLRKTYWLDEFGQRVTPACGRVVTEKRFYQWPVSLLSWLTERQRQGVAAAWSKACENYVTISESQLKIVTPADQSRFRAAGNSSYQPELVVEAQGGLGPYYWYINGQYVETTRNKRLIYKPTDPNRFQVLVTDRLGHIAMVTVYYDP